MTAQQEGKDLSERGKQKLNALQLDIKVAVADPLGDVLNKLTSHTSTLMTLVKQYHLLSEEELQQTQENLPTPEGGGPSRPSFG